MVVVEGCPVLLGRQLDMFVEEPIEEWLQESPVPDLLTWTSVNQGYDEIEDDDSEHCGENGAAKVGKSNIAGEGKCRNQRLLPPN